MSCDGELVFYAAGDDSAQLSLRTDNSPIWLTRIELAELFQAVKEERWS